MFCHRIDGPILHLSALGRSILRRKVTSSNRPQAHFSFSRGGPSRRPSMLRQFLVRPWIELGTERESLLQMLDEDAYFGGQAAAGRPNCKDRHNSFERSQKTDYGTFPEFCREEPRWRLGDPQMFEDTHPHLFDIAGPKDTCGDNTLGFLSRAKAPRLHGTPLDENDRSKAPEIVRRLGCA